MKNNETAASDLRQQAENEAQKKDRSSSLSEVDVRALCHKLEVHQIELELQNEELLRVQTKLAESEEKYRDLYEFAPIGYFTLEPKDPRGKSHRSFTPQNRKGETLEQPVPGLS